MNSYFVCFVYLFVCVFAKNFHRQLYKGDDCEQAKITRLAEQNGKMTTKMNKLECKTFTQGSSINSLENPLNKNLGATFTEVKEYSGPQQNYDSTKSGRNTPIFAEDAYYNPSVRYDNENTNNHGHTPPLQHMPSIMKKPPITPVTQSSELEPSSNEEDGPLERVTVIGGIDALEIEFPHMAALGYTNPNDKNKIWVCGGSLVSEQYVLTAAHCLYSKDYGPLKWVRLGQLNLASSIEPSTVQDYEVINKIAHPLYKAPAVYHDIALVSLDRKIIFTSFVKPACLYTQEYIPTDAQILATGWGFTNTSGKRSDILQKVDLEIFSEEECDQSYERISKTRRLKSGILHRQQMCVGGRSVEKDTCRGDSGGPLQIKAYDEGERYYILGITSFGITCGVPNKPGVYIRVSYYIPWIESVLWPNENY